jgi:hypothetical protein
LIKDDVPASKEAQTPKSLTNIKYFQRYLLLFMSPKKREYLYLLKFKTKLTLLYLTSPTHYNPNAN